MTDLPASSDVAIIGGGFAGCATAWALGRRGVRAVVLERESTLGRFASGRGAGLGRQLVDDDVTTALTVRGAAVLRGELSAAWAATGGILSFDDRAEAARYRDRAARFAVAVEPIEPAHVRACWPAFERLPIAAALRVPGDGVIDIKCLLAIYAASCDIAYGVTVQRAVHDGRGARLLTCRGELSAAVVVDAAGAWAGRATGHPPLEPFTRQLFAIEAVAGVTAPYLWHLGATEVYARRDGDAVLISACDAVLGEPCDAQPDPAGAARLRTLLEAAAPQYAGASVLRHWACQRTFTRERTMRLGRDAERPWLVWAAGLGGHGATASAAVGETVAGAVIAALDRVA
ncbi:MAG: NAD(P)/FAD-dependent oxidoreductase [Kofleriaceae bacterium]